MKRTRQQRKMSHHPYALRRGGFTLIELMVVVAIIATLIGIIVPAVSSARASARNAQCLNNIRNVGLAINNLATSNNGKYPYLEDGNVGWPVRILERFDQAALAREIRANGLPSPVPVLEGLTCPDDLDSSGAAGGLSYVANCGYVQRGLWGTANELTHSSTVIAWNVTPGATQDRIKVSYATGILWRQDSTGSRQTLDAVSNGDGAGQTVLLAENVNAGLWPNRGTGEIGFSIFVNTSGSGRPSQIGQVMGATTSTALTLQTSCEIGISQPNSNLQTSSPGTAWRPSSQHAGSINFVFCDGHGASVSGQIDPFVYARILTPNGGRYGQTPVSSDEY